MFIFIISLLLRKNGLYYRLERYLTTMQRSELFTNEMQS